MLVELLAKGRRAGQVGLDGGHGRRRRDVDAEQVLDGPRAAHVTGDVVVPLAVTLRMLACVSSAAADRVLAAVSRGGNCTPLDAGDAVVLGQPVIEHRPVGIDELHHAQVSPQHFVEEPPGLLDPSSIRASASYSG